MGQQLCRTLFVINMVSAMIFKRCFLNAFLLFLFFQFCVSTDTLSPTQSIMDGEILISSGETFALGFFSPINSKNRYVGIWYNKDPAKTVVWVANRDKPIQDSTGVLTINDDGNLIIFNGDRESPLWSTNVSPATSNSIVKLFDTGNLVLSGGPSNTALWESFDHPTNTMLPDMKLGLNLKTGLNWSLTSWKSIDDPANGDYSTMLDPRGSPQFFLYKSLVRDWRSGPWNGREWSGIPRTKWPNSFRSNFVSNGDEIYMSYMFNNPSIMSRLVLDESGSAQWLTWFNRNREWKVFRVLHRDRCDDYGLCGAFGSCNSDDAVECRCLPGFEPKSTQDWDLRDWSGGCLRKRILKCGKGEGFLKLTHLKVPDTSISRVDMKLSLEDCEKECLRNCNCTGYTKAIISGKGSGCLSWYGDLMDVREYTDGGQDLYLRVDAAELDSEGFLGEVRNVVILTVSLVLGVLLLVLCGFYLSNNRKTKGGIEKERRHERLLYDFTTKSIKFKDSDNRNELEDNRTDTELRVFELNVIIAATDNFSSSNKVGQGGFGSVYKGRLFNGQEIAVKRLSKNSGQGTTELKNEVMLIAKLQHRNLVRLLGCCIQGEEKMLIYEYMPNKSLDTFIFDRSRRALMEWRKRFEIIVGIARGILYLHQDSRLRIIHRDLKPSNVLLDADMTPKISDFGMARIFRGNQTQANTNRVVGTCGYMSPEYAMEGLFSVKSDVFSFGVILLEIICGKNNSYYCEDPCLNLIGHAWDLWIEGRAWEIVDSSMDDMSPTHEVLRCIQVGLLCVQESASDRPTMSTVVFMLINETAMHPPKRPAFVTRKTRKDPLSSSINEMTITTTEAR